MSDTDNTWGTLPFPGLLPDFHADPTEGGAPLVSLDGHWWWDGHAWTPLAEAPPAEVLDRAQAV
jgi:hypothetical protein